MTSLGRLIFFDQPGTGASDPITPGALPTPEQWTDSITAVLDDLGSREAVLVAFGGAIASAALFAATHPSRTTALVVLEGYAHPIAERTDGVNSEELLAAMALMWGTGETQHVINPDMPWNDEIRATWARHDRLAASPSTYALVLPLLTEVDVRAALPTVRVPTRRFDAPATSDPLRDGDSRRGAGPQHSGARWVAHRRMRDPWRRHRRNRRAHRCSRERPWPGRTTCSSPARCATS